MSLLTRTSSLQEQTRPTSEAQQEKCIARSHLELYKIWVMACARFTTIVRSSMPNQEQKPSFRYSVRFWFRITVSRRIGSLVSVLRVRLSFGSLISLFSHTFFSLIQSLSKLLGCFSIVRNGCSRLFCC